MERYAGMRFEPPPSQEARAGSAQSRPEPDYQLSIKGHLWRLLNTRRGSVLIDPDYGVPDLTLGSRAYDEDEVQSILKTVIQRYERRLEKLRLTLVQDDGENRVECRFLIQGLLSINRETLPVELRAVLLADGTCNFE
jgi:type VI secretion system protein